VTAEDAADRSGVRVLDGLDVQAELEAGATPWNPHNLVAEDRPRESFAVGGRCDRKARDVSNVVEVQDGDGLGREARLRWELRDLGSQLGARLRQRRVDERIDNQYRARLGTAGVTQPQRCPRREVRDSARAANREQRRIDAEFRCVLEAPGKGGEHVVRGDGEVHSPAPGSAPGAAKPRRAAKPWGGANR